MIIAVSGAGKHKKGQYARHDYIEQFLLIADVRDNHGGDKQANDIKGNEDNLLKFKCKENAHSNYTGEEYSERIFWIKHGEQEADRKGGAEQENAKYNNQSVSACCCPAL